MFTIFYHNLGQVICEVRLPFSALLSRVRNFPHRNVLTPPKLASPKLKRENDYSSIRPLALVSLLPHSPTHALKSSAITLGLEQLANEG